MCCVVSASRLRAAGEATQQYLDAMCRVVAWAKSPRQVVFAVRLLRVLADAEAFVTDWAWECVGQALEDWHMRELAEGPSSYSQVEYDEAYGR